MTHGNNHRRLAWFSPMPPARSGVAACSAELVAALADDYDIDVFVEESGRAGLHSAHDFVWRHRRHPYALTVYQLGNSALHEYEWPYVFRYPGLVVLHDSRLHHARAAALLRAGRPDDYRTEFAANHPTLSPDLAELATKGFDNHLFYAWPMVRLILQTSRLVAAHNRAIADELQGEAPGARVEAIRLGHGTPKAEAGARARVRSRYGISEGAVVFGCFGGLSPEKRLPQVLGAFAWLRARVPDVHLLLAGGAPAHYELAADVARHGLGDCSTLTGYLDEDRDLTACIEAADVALTLRWPTAREISGPWLRCLALGKPTVIVHLRHLSDVPSLDPRDWRPTTRASTGSAADGTGEPVSVAIDIIDEDHSLRLAMRRLATDPLLRASLGRAARGYWQNHHSVDGMVDDYRRIIPLAIKSVREPVALPPHLINDGDRRLESLLAPFGLPSPLG